MGDVKAALGRLEPLIIRMDERMAHLAGKSELEALRSDMAHVASKSELEALRGDVAHVASKSELEALRGDVAHVASKGELEALRIEVADLSATLRGMPSRGFVIGVVVAIVTLVMATIAMVPAIQRGIGAL